MIRCLLLCAAILLILSFAWLQQSFTIHTRAALNLGRELQGFEARLERTLETAEPECRQLLINSGVVVAAGQKLDLNGASDGETFEQMRVRLTRSLLPPYWPGLAGGFFGVSFLCIALSESKADRGHPQRGSNAGPVGLGNASAKEEH